MRIERSFRWEPKAARAAWLCGLATFIGVAALRASAPQSTVYVSGFFEVRENKQPTKYVFAGATRVAQITGSLSSSARVQRLALHAGWNLLSLAVTAADPRGQMTNSQPTNLDPRLVFRWDPQGAVWQPVLAGETLAAGAVVLAHSRTNATLTLTGTYTDPTNRPVASGTASFLAGAGLEALPLLAQSANLELWHQDPAAQDWQVHKPNAAYSDPDFPEALPPGGAIFVRAASSGVLEVPDETLRLRYHHQDHLGSSTAITDAAGSLVEETAFHPFGAPRQEFELRGIGTPYKFTQKERDTESLLHYFESRYLAGPLARFVTVDRKYANPDLLSHGDFAASVARPQALNLYAYCSNNPLRFVDPDGNETVLAVGGQVEAGGGLGASAQIDAAAFLPDASDWYKPWKYDIGLCYTSAQGVSSPGASATLNVSVNPGGRSSFEGNTTVFEASAGEGPVFSGSFAKGTGQPTTSFGYGVGVGPPVQGVIKRANTKCVTVGDAIGALTEGVSLADLQNYIPRAAKVEHPSPTESTSIRSSSVSNVEPPPPPAPRPKHTPPPPSRQTRTPRECWTRGVPP